MEKLATEILTLFGVKNVDSVVRTNSAEQLQAIVNFKTACCYENLRIKWGKEQIDAFLNILEKLYYTAPTLNKQWKFIRDLGWSMDSPVSNNQEDEFERILANCKNIGDKKVPVSRQLLRELIKAADDMFLKYNATLTKALFVVAFAGCMRICEYSYTRPGKPDHNIWHDSVTTCESTLNVTYRSDKVTKKNSAVLHFSYPWTFLPPGAMKIVDDYISIRPPESKYFFCQEDGKALNRDFVTDILNLCVLQTSYRNLTILPHSFR